MTILEQIRQKEDTLSAYRNCLHINPELSGQEYNTLKFIREKLDENRVEWLEIEKGGILAWVNGKQDNGLSVLLRADIDALPIDEDCLNGEGIAKKTVSCQKGVAHMCGHDCHTSMLLNALIFLKENQNMFSGRVYGIFERGEEANGNIFHIIRYFEEHDYHFDSSFGLHVMVRPDIETGTIILKEGNFYASMCDFRFRIIGKGGHGSRPELANSPIDCFAEAYQRIRELKKQFTDENRPLTYSIGMVNAGTVSNVIPESLQFAGTIRFYDMEYGREFFERMTEIIESTCREYGCRCEIEKNTIPGYSVINNPDATAFAEKTFSQQLKVENGEEMLITESFSFLQLHCPSTFAGLIVSNRKKGMTADIHTPQFEPDLDALYKGCAAYVLYAVSYLNEKPDFKFTDKAVTADQIIRECGVQLP